MWYFGIVLIQLLVGLFLLLIGIFFSFVTVLFFSDIISFLLPSSIAASANHHYSSICSFIINYLLQNSICSSPYRADKHFTTWVGHEANFKVEFLQTHATVFLIEMFWNEIMKVERFLIS